MSMFYKKSEPLGTLSSGGHTILNKLKQALTQRTKLMFGGGLKATDNSQDGITLVDDSADEIEFSDWIAKTEEEKEEYAEEHAKFDIINAPGVDELVELKLLTKLWENPAPSQAFAAQTVTLASDNYDFLLITNKNSIAGTIFASDICAKGFDTRIHYTTAIGNYYRTLTRTDNTHYSISTCVNDSGSAASNDSVIPIIIYGFKTNIKSIISAIASDVSTSASKCMMSDGETSVEDAISKVSKFKYISCTKTEVSTNAVKAAVSETLGDFEEYCVEFEIAGNKYTTPIMHRTGVAELLVSLGNQNYQVIGYGVLVDNGTNIQGSYTVKGSSMASYPLYLTGIYVR